jgi:hypothetical protein
MRKEYFLRAFSSRAGGQGDDAAAENAAGVEGHNGMGGDIAKVASLLQECEVALQEPLSRIITHWKVKGYFWPQGFQWGLRERK